MPTDEAEVELDVLRGGLDLAFSIEKRERGSRSASRCRAPCSTRCAPATTTASSASSTSCRQGMRRSLYLKDDDYRLSFLYGNFTTLTRFTEADLERVVTERLSPLHVSIHATDPDVRSRDAAQPPGRHEPALAAGPARPRHRRCTARSSCVPGVNDGAVLDDTLAGVLDQYPGAGSRGVVPLGVSAFNAEAAHAPPHARGGRGRRRHRRRLAGRVPGDARPAAGLRRRRVLPAGRAAVPRRRALRGLPDARGRHRAWPARSSSSSTDAPSEATGVRRGFFACGRRPARTRRPTPDCGAHRRARPGPARRCQRRSRCGPAGRRRSASSPASYGAPVLAPLVDVARPRRRAGDRGRATTSSAATPASPACMIGEDLARVAGRRAAGPSLPAARRLPVRRGSLPRRHHARRPAPAGRGRRHRRHRPAQCPRTDRLTPERNNHDSQRADRRPTDRPAPTTTCRRAATVVVVGRPNVGKCTLFNRIVGQPARPSWRSSPGVTRDRKELEAEWLGIPFRVVDTGGWMPGGDDLDAKVQPPGARRPSRAPTSCCSSSTRPSASPTTTSRVANWLRRSGTHGARSSPTRSTTTAARPRSWEFMRLGLGEPVPGECAARPAHRRPARRRRRAVPRAARSRRRSPTRGRPKRRRERRAARRAACRHRRAAQRRQVARCSTG